MNKEMTSSRASMVWRLLTFRVSREELLAVDRRHLAMGLVATWIVGMGRYWDDAGAHVLQHMGMGSVVYVFCLSLFIWLVLKPYLVEEWSYFRVLTFISLTSFPAILYAIPVERFLSIEVAASMNVWFLAVVATWRLALLFFFLRIFTRLAYGHIAVAALLPVCLIIVALTALNLERAVFDIMGGIRDTTSNDRAYQVLFMLTMLASLLAGPLLVAYVVGIVVRRRALRK